MPVSKAILNGTQKLKARTLSVVEIVRDGSFYWQTETKLPPNMQSLGWKEVEDGLFEVERPKRKDVAAFGREIEALGWKIKRSEYMVIGEAPKLKPTEKTEGESKLGEYLTAKESLEEAKTEVETKKVVLRDWMTINAAPKDPAHGDARLAQIGSYKVHNSWVNGRETKWDDRDHSPVGDWAIEEGYADELCNVIMHRTVTFEEYEREGIPEGFEGSVVIDPETYDYYNRVGAVPKEIHEEFEGRGKGHYAVKVYETKELSCTGCGMTMKKTQKFCGECGQKK
jgi:hypothetical protein